MHPRHLIAALQRAKASIEQAIRDYEGWVRHINATMPDGFPTGGDIDHVSGGGAGDPTGSSVLGRRQGTRLLHDAEKTIDGIDNLTRHLDALLASGPRRVDVATITRTSRCSGQVDPTCTNLADGQRRKSGLCDRCWMVRYRAERRAS
jgi:hypothetical protein